MAITQGKNEQLVSISALFKEAPSGFNIGDLSEISEVLSQFEQALTVIDEDDPNFHQLFTTLIDFTEKLVLGDIEDSDSGIKYLNSAISILQALPESVDYLADISALQHDPIVNSDGKDNEADALPKTSPPMGTMAIHNNDDIIVYTEFISEALEHFDSIEEHILDLERSGLSLDVINEMFRCFHSAKGAAGFLGLSALNRLCHECETLLDRMRKQTIQIDGEIADILLLSIDSSRKMMDIINEGLKEECWGKELPAFDILPLINRIEAILNRGACTIVAGSDILPDSSRIGGMLVESGAVNEMQLSQALAQQKKPVGEILVDMGVATPEQVEQAISSASAPQKVQAESIKVDVTRLNALLEMVGELVICQTQVAGDDSLSAQDNDKLIRNINNLGKITDNIQELVMSLRLIPIRGLFNKMVRVVRDTAQKTGKVVNLEMDGADTEVDKNVVEHIADPLIHLIRNSVDHGIESIEKRVNAGKPEEGTVKLRACHTGGNVVIEVYDDGGGINIDRVKEKAIEKGVIAPDAVLSESEIYDLIFLPGFSTHKVATDISGRGVGMDVVKSNIKKLGGRVDVTSILGKGTTFTIRLPLTMAIVDGMVVEVHDQHFVLPTLAIEESLRPAAEQICTVTGGKAKALEIRGELMPIVSLRELFNFDGELDCIEGTLMIIVREGNKRCALVIDQMINQQQVVIKNLGKKFSGITGVSAGCILGDGRVGLILDVPGIIQLAESV